MTRPDELPASVLQVIDMGTTTNTIQVRKTLT
jgi:hypothetical protein